MIEVCKQTLTYREVMMWMKYIKKYGSLNVGLRIERHVGLLSYNHERANSKGDVDIKRHIPHLLEDDSMTPVQREFAKWGVTYDPSKAN